MTTLLINGDGLSFTSPNETSTIYSQRSDGGDWTGKNYSLTWKGENLKYNKESWTSNLFPQEGTLTELSFKSATGQLLYSVKDTNYIVSFLDSYATADQLATSMLESFSTVNIFGGSENDTLYWYISELASLLTDNPTAKINGGPGVDTLILPGNFNNFTFSNFIASNSSATIHNISNNIDADLTSIEKIIFNDKTINFSELTGNSLIQNPQPIVSNKLSNLTVIVDKNIIGTSAVILKNLIETTTYTNGAITSHTIDYGGSKFNYDAIDSLLCTVVRDGEFTSEFNKEITDLLPLASNFTYQDTIKLVGSTNIDNVLLYVAGSDGNFVN